MHYRVSWFLATFPQKKLRFLKSKGRIDRRLQVSCSRGGDAGPESIEQASREDSE